MHGATIKIPQLHVSAYCMSLMFVYIRKSKHVVEVVKYTRYTGRNRQVSVPHTYKHTNLSTARLQMANTTFRREDRSPSAGNRYVKNYSFGPEKPNCTLVCLLFVALVMTE